MDSQHEIRIDLTLVEEGSKKVEEAPNDVSIGAVRLRRWQVDPIDAPAGMFEGYESYLVKINYELELEPGLPWMKWFEVAFDFTSDKEAGLIVLDAIPASGPPSRTPTSFVLNRYLNLVPCDNGATAHAFLPAATDPVLMSGVGSRRIRWRHTAAGDTGVHPGSYAAWAVVLVPAGQSEQRVDFSARYDLEVGAEVDYQPTQLSADFVLPFTASTETPGVLTPSFSADDRRREAEYHPRVALSYAHDTGAHKKCVLSFSELLVTCGVDLHMDQWDSNYRKDWSIWSSDEFDEDEPEFIICVASPMFCAAFNGKLGSDTHRGIQSEAAIIREKLHSNRKEWTRKLLPVVLPHESVENIPVQLQRRTADHYVIDELTPEGIDELLRAMTGVPLHTRPPLGKLPPGVIEPLGGAES